MIFNAARKEVSASDNQAGSVQEIVREVPFRSVTPNDRKHKYEEGGDVAHECTSSRASKCQRSNSLGSYFVPIVPSIENSVKESQLQFDELEIVDTLNSSCQQPESVFHFIPVIDSNHTNKALQDESRVSLCSDSKCTSNFADEHVLSCSHPSCDDLNSDPRFFQSQSAPAQLLTDESEHLLQHPNITTNTSPSPAFPAISEASPKSSTKVTSASDFEYKLFDVSSAEKRRRVSTSAAREDVNVDDFDNYTTGESSLCDSSRRSLAPRRSPLRDYFTTKSSSSRSKVSLTGDDVYTDHSSRRTHARSSSSSQSHHRGRSVTRSCTSGYSIGRTEGRKSRERSKNRVSGSSTERNSSKGTVSSYSRHTTHTSYTYTTHTYSNSYRHDCVDSRYSEYAEVTHSVPTPPSSSYSCYRDSRSRERRKVSSGYDAYTNSYTVSGYHTDIRSPSPIHTHAYTSKDHTHQNSPNPHSSIQPSPRAETDPLSTVATTTTVTTDPDNFRYYRGLSYRDLPLEWWERTEHCKEAKLRHTDRIDHMCGSRESLVLKTTLWKEDIVLEPNMFPYYTPYGVEHYTLWSVEDLSHQQIVTFVDGWLYRHMPHVRRWQYDDNSGERSIDLFHVHVFIETAPFQYAPREGMLYIPPHAALPVLAEVEVDG